MTYAQKLKDPRWQRRRLEVLSQANFKCQICKSGADELAVHHVNYKRNTEPWEYDAEVDLVCLCKRCHERLEVDVIPLARVIAVKFHPETVFVLLKALRDIAFCQSAQNTSFRTGSDEVQKILNAIPVAATVWDASSKLQEARFLELMEALK